MKLEFLESGGPDCPLIRLYEFDLKEAYQLRRAALQLARGKVTMILLHKQPYITPIGSCELTLHRRNKNCGVSKISALKFDWVLSPTGWLQVAGRVRPFSRELLPGWSWLSDGGKVNVLLSCSRSW